MHGTHLDPSGSSYWFAAAKRGASHSMPSSTKQDLRAQLRALRIAIPQQEQELAAINLASNVQKLPYFLDAKNIAIYWPHDSEISPMILMHRALELGKQCYLPILRVDYKQKLSFASYTTNMPVIKNRYDILEPELNYAKLIDLIELDIIFTPLVGFDSQGHRLGRGGGFYDATFADLSDIPHKDWPKLVGLGYDCQEAATIPMEHLDWRLDSVITESRILEF